jgi:hypothetical protein
MFMYSFSNPVTLDRNEVYEDPEHKSRPIKCVTPNAGVSNGLSSNDDKDDDVDNAMMQVQ